jgi:hypothetical protein
MKARVLALIAAALAAVLLLAPQAASAGSPTVLGPCEWFVLANSTSSNAFFPETSATYWQTTIKGSLLAGLASSGLVLRGTFPRARFFSFVAYNVQGDIISSIYDAAVAPDPGSANPFATLDAPEGGRYSIRVLALGSKAAAAANATGEANVLLVDKTLGSVLYRVYNPDNSTGATGGVPLPNFVLTGRAGLGPAATFSPCSPPNGPVAQAALGFRQAALGSTLAPLTTPAQPLMLRASGGGGLFANPQNAYLTAPTNWTVPGRLAVWRGLGAAFPDTEAGQQVVPARALRFWSMCSNKYVSPLPVVACKDDFETALDPLGRYTYVMGLPADQPAAAVLAARSATWVPALGAGDPTTTVGVALFRNLLPGAGFAQSVQAAPADNSPASARAAMGPYYPLGVYCDAAVFAAAGFEGCLAAAAGEAAPAANPPWFPSLDAFEHHDSPRSHVFPLATFGPAPGAQASAQQSPEFFPTVYNAVTQSVDDLFVFGGTYGNKNDTLDPRGRVTAPFVASLDPVSLTRRWHTSLWSASIDVSGQWDYPGVMGTLSDGFLYAAAGFQLFKLNPASGAIVATLNLPTTTTYDNGTAVTWPPFSTAYNGFNALPDGTLVAKSLYRQLGCDIQGPTAVLQCVRVGPQPLPLLVTVDPKTMTLVSSVILGSPSASARPTVSTFQGTNYVYVPADGTAYRFVVPPSGVLGQPDPTWVPGPLVAAGQTVPTSFVVVGDWVVLQTNILPATAPMSVIAINQGNANVRYQSQPFAALAPTPGFAFRQQVVNATVDNTGGVLPVSFAPASVSADPASGLIFATDSLPGLVAALRIDTGTQSLQTVWVANQVTTEFTLLVGRQAGDRVLVGTDIPLDEAPGVNRHDFVVWRSAATGAELLRSAKLPSITQGTMVQPSYGGSVLYPGYDGTFTRLGTR